jgi:hypothetical protein
MPPFIIRTDNRPDMVGLVNELVDWIAGLFQADCRTPILRRCGAR